ncbi:aminotransferase-like domain-containing protein [Helicovermis profundi]|uniref:HTH-type transcriptional regulator NorG n=1 Tax=Helicovermis profundi TaxID=3065157 RepID=A0AAU9EAZ4_9FIRM|nr:PLP-dependent aminotransferase family protein [Clostridia bacterium S502]
MKFTINRNDPLPLYLQIKNEIEMLILSEEYPNGFILLSERKLADILGVNRSTTIKSYDLLKDMGLIESKVGKGTYVIYEKNIANNENIFNEIYWDNYLGNYSFKNSINIMSKIMSEVSKENLISLSGGFPSKEVYPYDKLKQINIEILENNEIFFQTPVRGDRAFVLTLIKYLYSNKHIKLNHKELMVTSGSQQALNLLIQTFVNPGDNIIIENPSFFGAIHLFRKAKANLISTNISGEGIDLNHIEFQLKNNNIKFMYLLPNFQNPTGYNMSIEDRKKILYLSKKYKVPIIEEDPYGELYFDKYTPSIKSLDTENFVVHIGTFSKTLSPGFRIGYIAADKTVIKKLTLLNQFIDIHANTISQNIINKFLSKDFYNEHLEIVRSHYKLKRDAMVNELNKGQLTFQIPKGGYYIWCQLDKRISVDLLLKESLKNGVDFIPGEFFFNNSYEGRNFIRLNFTSSTKKEIIKGVRIINDIIKNMR